jgi:hypothetical protein
MTDFSLIDSFVIVHRTVKRKIELLLELEKKRRSDSAPAQFHSQLAPLRLRSDLLILKDRSLQLRRSSLIAPLRSAPGAELAPWSGRSGVGAAHLCPKAILS